MAPLKNPDWERGTSRTDKSETDNSEQNKSGNSSPEKENTEKGQFWKWKRWNITILNRTHLTTDFSEEEQFVKGQF